MALQEPAQNPAGEPVRGILAENRGLPSSAQDFDHLGFKGESAPGQLTLTWYGEAGEGGLVTIIQVASAEPVDPNLILGPAADTLQLLREGSAGG